MESHPPDLATLSAQLREYRIGEWNVRLGVEQDWRCVYCGKDLVGAFDDYNSWQWDHIIPRAIGGEHSFENLAVCCKTCNWLKRTYAPSGTTRSELISDAQQYIRQQRAAYEQELNEIRLLVRDGISRPG